MTTKNKHLLIALAIAAVLTAAVVAYYLHRKKSGSSSAAAGAAPSVAPPEAPAESVSPTSGMGSMGGSFGGWPPVTGGVIHMPAPPVVIMTLAPEAKADMEVVATAKPLVKAPNLPAAGSLDLAPSGVGAVTTPTPTPTAQEPTTGFPLKPGSTGPEVEQLQSFLVIEHGAQFPAGITGNFDGSTQAAVARHLRRDTISQAFFNKVGMGNRRRI